MTSLRITVTVEIDGEDADGVAEYLRVDVEAGELDQHALEMLRDHLWRIGGQVVGDDWRIVRVVASTGLPNGSEVAS